MCLSNFGILANTTAVLYQLANSSRNFGFTSSGPKYLPMTRPSLSSRIPPALVGGEVARRGKHQLTEIQIQTLDLPGVPPQAFVG
jgi:hypothetical protein